MNEAIEGVWREAEDDGQDGQGNGGFDAQSAAADSSTSLVRVNQPRPEADGGNFNNQHSNSENNESTIPPELQEIRNVLQELRAGLLSLTQNIQDRVDFKPESKKFGDVAADVIRETILPLRQKIFLLLAKIVEKQSQSGEEILSSDQQQAIRTEMARINRTYTEIYRYYEQMDVDSGTQSNRADSRSSEPPPNASRTTNQDSQPPAEPPPPPEPPSNDRGGRESEAHDSDREFMDITKKSLESFMIQTGIPKRESKEEYKDVRIYLEAVHEALLNRAAVAVLDGLLDPSSSPRTFNYHDNPMYGPGKEMDLITLQLIYAAADWQSVKTFESFLDEFPKYFSDESEKELVTKYKKRTREQLVEMSVWHNRAYIRRNNQDATGPTGAFNAIRQIYENKSSHGLAPAVKPLFLSKSEHPDLLDSEEKFGKAINLMMSFWSLRTLKKRDRMRLWPQVNQKLKETFYSNQGDLLPEYDVLPVYRSTKPKQIALVEKLVELCESECGVSKQQALFAYDIGEKFRIGAGMEAFMDAKYGDSVAAADAELKPTNNMSVQAQEGEPKAANIGLYVDSAVSNTARPDFIQPFADQMVHGYVPYSVAANYSYRGPDDVGDFHDHRATLAELMAVEGGTSRIDWSTGSTNPDKVVFQLANQTANFLWPCARLDKATTSEFSFFIDLGSIPLNKSLLLDREDEMVRIGSMLGFYNPKRKTPFTRRISDRVQGRRGVENMEQFGFVSKSEPFSMQRVQGIKKMYKDQRDYWLNALIPDVQGKDGDRPYDSVRVLRFLFSRDDGPNGYVNKKIGKKIESLKGKPINNGKWFQKEMYPWLQGYITYDLLLRSVYYMLQPDFRGVPELRGNPSDEQLRQIYEGISFANFENYNVQTLAGTPPLNRAQLGHLINQSMLLLNLIPAGKDGKTETDKMVDAGYRLFEDVDDEGIVFDQQELLHLAKTYDMGSGYVMGISAGPNGEEFVTLFRDEYAETRPTKQYIIDRLTLCNWLFSRKRLKK